MVLVTASPTLQPIPHRDSGVFLYIGKGILLGKLPYLDFWDHKGPLIYYINALGFLFSTNSYWGVWLIEILCLSLTIMLSFSLMEYQFGAWAAFTGTALWVFALGRIFTSQFGAGNHVEEYALLFYMGQIYLFLRNDSEGQGVGRFFLMGIFAGMGILLRPNLSSPLFGIYLTILWSMRDSGKDSLLQAAYTLVALTIGVAAPLAIVIIYFGHLHALPYLLNDAIIYNFFYTGSGSLYISAFTSSFNLMGPLNVIGMFAWLLLISFPKKMVIITGDRRLGRFLVIVLPIEIIFSLISGQGYIHYFISWLPLLGLLSCILMQVAQWILERLNSNWALIYTHIIFIAILIAQAVPFAKDYSVYAVELIKNIKSGNLFITDERRSPEWDGVKQLYEFAPKNSEVIFWGNEVEYNFVMELPSPSRYIYINPFLSPVYASLDMQEELLAVLKTRKPVIVDIQPSPTPPLKSLSKWSAYPKAMSFIRYVTENYTIKREIQVISYYYTNGQNWQVTQKWIVWTHK